MSIKVGQVDGFVPAFVIKRYCECPAGKIGEVQDRTSGLIVRVPVGKIGLKLIPGGILILTVADPVKLVSVFGQLVVV